MNLLYQGFSTWYPAKDLMESSVTTRRVHKWFVNMLPQATNRYNVITRDETKDEGFERFVADCEIEAYAEDEMRNYFNTAKWNFEQMNFSAERAEELATNAMKVWFSNA